MKAKKRVLKKRPKVLKNFYNLQEQGISQSALKTFMSCRRKWMLNIAGLTAPNIQKNTHFGTIVHEMLDRVYQNLHKIELENIPSFVEEQLTLYLKENEEEIAIPTEQNELEKAMALAVVPEFFNFFHRDKENFSELTPEYEFSHPFEEITLRGKVDGIVKVQNDFWQIEHKTKSRIDEDGILKSLQFDYQNLMYSLVLDEQLADKGGIKGVLYNIIRKPSIRQTKKETAQEFITRLKKDIIARPEWYFIRYEIVYSKQEKKRFRNQLSGAVSELKRFVAGELPDLQNPAHCLFPFKCQYLDVCSNNSTQGLKLRETLHPELDADCSVNKDILKFYKLQPPK